MNLSTFVFSASVILKSKNITISRSHLHEILASGLGYNTLAAYQNSTEENPGIAGATHILLDLPAMSSRAQAFGHSSGGQIIAALKKAITSAPHSPRIHDSIKDFFDNVVSEHVEQNVDNEDEVSSAMAETNAYSDSVEVERGDTTPIAVSTDFWDVPFHYTLNMDQDPDRVYHGDKITGGGLFRCQKVGRVCLDDDFSLAEVSGGIVHDDDGQDQDYDPE